MSNYSLKPIKISTEEFLGAFFDAGDNICFRIFSDKPGSAFSGLSLDITQGHFDKLAESLHKHNAQDRGIFFVINFGGHAVSVIMFVGNVSLTTGGYVLGWLPARCLERLGIKKRGV